MTARVFIRRAFVLMWLCCFFHAVALAGNAPATQPIINSLGMKFVRIEPGEFQMGSPETEPGRGDNEPRHRVRLTRPFLIATHCVTVKQFAEFARGYRTDAERKGFVWAGNADGTQWGPVKGLTWNNPGFDQRDDHPAVCVSWNDATAFCQWLSHKEQVHYRLPREAEWEYCSRAGANTAYPWGDKPDDGQGCCNGADQTYLARYPNYAAISFGFRDGFVYTSPVGSFRPNAWGLYDMLGNVWQWCTDWYGEDLVADAIDPAGPPTGHTHIHRGGAWDDGPALTRCAHRHGSIPDFASNSTGFRLCRDLPE